MVFDGAQALRGVTGVVAVGGGFDGLAAPASLLANLQEQFVRNGREYRGGESTILYMGTEPYVIATNPTMTLKT